MIKRVLIFSTDDFIPPAGGAEIAIGEITKRVSSEYKFLLICARLNRKRSKIQKYNEQMTILRVGWGIPFVDKVVLAFFGSYIAKKIHKITPFDLVWSMMASYGGFAAVKFKKTTGVPYLLTLQEGDDLDEIEHKARFFKNKFREVFSTADSLQPISYFLANWGKKMGFSGNLLEVIPNGVDFENFSQEFSGEELSQIRKSWNFPEDAVVLTTSSRLEKKNGVGDIIKSLVYLPSNICFVICGFGSLEQELKDLMEKLSLQNRVKFLGLITHKDLPKIFRVSDIFIRPSLTEGLGNAFLEAMAVKLPIIGTLVGGIPDFLTDGVTGFVCLPENPQSIAEAVNKIINLDKSKKEKIISDCFQLVKEKYNWSGISLSMKNIFDETIEKKRV